MLRDEIEREIASDIKAALEKAAPFSREKAKGVIDAYLDELEKRGFVDYPRVDVELTIEFTCSPLES